MRILLFILLSISLNAQVDTFVFVKPIMVGDSIKFQRKTAISDTITQSLVIDTLAITVTALPSPFDATGKNIGDGEGEIFKAKVGSDIEMRTILAGVGQTVATSGDVIRIQPDTSIIATKFYVGTQSGGGSDTTTRVYVVDNGSRSPSVTTAQDILQNPIYLEANSTYQFECRFRGANTGGSAISYATLFLFNYSNGLTVSSIEWSLTGTAQLNNANGTASMGAFNTNEQTTAVGGTSSSRGRNYIYHGYIVTTNAGSFMPQFRNNGNTGSTTFDIWAYFKITKVN